MTKNYTNREIDSIGAGDCSEVMTSKNETSTLEARPSRRGILGALAAAGGITGAVAWFGIPEPGDIPLVGEEQSDDDSELLSEREALLRSQVYDNRISLVPSFSYESILEDLDGSEGVERIGAEPADSELGDRLAIFAASETATTLKTVLTEKWGDPSSSQEYVTSVDDQRVPFDLSAGSEIAIGATVRDSQSTNLTELLVARGTNESVVEDLIDNFTPFYLDIVP